MEKIELKSSSTQEVLKVINIRSDVIDNYSNQSSVYNLQTNLPTMACNTSQ